ncbi:DoxX family protein [Haloflavibacter putidus]|uniref:DoxX family protein n=1 Tax=Haloflavibacter putidus TaxID=2576776 RepID=A0A507ZM68_9FLAO|nr:DoxX family protein [Haloflavibacter putidus]TQD37663.1 DoxX family protein [Haloflavibacter putidus]
MSEKYTTNLSLQRLDFGILFFRVILSGLMLVHGIPKLLMLFGGNEIQFLDPIGVGVGASLALAVFAEIVCSVLIILGLGTRFAVIPLIILLVTAGTIVHAEDPWMRQELPFLYTLCYLFLFYSGAGRFSLDFYFMRKKNLKA